MAALETQPSEQAANTEPLNVRQAMILLDCSMNRVRRAINSGRWPATFEDGHYLIEPSVLVERWAMELTNKWLGPDTRKSLAARAIASGYPLDVDALQRACERHLQRQLG